MVRKNFGAKPYTYPQPVLMIATYGEDGTPDVMKAAPITFDPSNNAYIKLGEKVADAFKIGAALK